jgi:hypothetical protein
MAQEIDDKLEQLKALLDELGATDEYNMFVVVEDKKQEKTFSGLCGTIRDIKAALCYAFDIDIAGFTVAVHSILTYAITHGTLEKDGVLFNDITELMFETREAREKEIQQRNEENNG